MSEHFAKPGAGTGLEREETIERPRRYKVLLLNDNYTAMDFVVMVLERIYRRSSMDAVSIMLNVHRNGMGVAGVYIRAIAETKADETHRMAREHGYPLRCSLEPE